MLFNSLNYLIFFPIVILFYFAIPAKYKEIRNFWLLVASYFFYMNWNARYALLLFASTFITYLAGIGIDRAKVKEKLVLAKWILGLSFAINLGILFFYMMLWENGFKRAEKGPALLWLFGCLYGELLNISSFN